MLLDIDPIFSVPISCCLFNCTQKRIVHSSRQPMQMEGALTGGNINLILHLYKVLGRPAIDLQNEIKPTN